MIYVLQETDPPYRIKIGYSSNVEKRFAVLSATLPQKIKLLKTMEGQREDEAFFHELLKPFRVQGTREWYYPSPEVLDTLDCDWILDSAG